MRVLFFLLSIYCFQCVASDLSNVKIEKTYACSYKIIHHEIGMWKSGINKINKLIDETLLKKGFHPVFDHVGAVEYEVHVWTKTSTGPFRLRPLAKSYVVKPEVIIHKSASSDSVKNEVQWTEYAKFYNFKSRKKRLNLILKGIQMSLESIPFC